MAQPRVIASELFRSLGGEIHLTHVSPNGRNINENCGALHPEVVAGETKALGADLGITFDGDADRALFADAHGRVVNGDGVMLVAARDMQARANWQATWWWPRLCRTWALEAALRSNSIRMLRAPVGDKYVLEMMQKHQASLGGEQSGHILFLRPQHHRRRITHCARVARYPGAIREASARVAKRSAGFSPGDRQCAGARETPLEEIPAVVESIEHAERDLHGNGRVVVRYSGTEALARVMIEAQSEQQMREHAERIAQAIREEIGV